MHFTPTSVDQRHEAFKALPWDLSGQKMHLTPTSVDKQHEAVKALSWDLSGQKMHFTPPTSVDKQHEAVKALPWDLSSVRKCTALQRLLTNSMRQSKHATGTSLQPENALHSNVC